METVLGLDPAMGNVGWAHLEKTSSTSWAYCGSGVVKHGLIGTGKYDAKIKRQVERTLEAVEGLNPGLVVVEVPHYGSWGKDSVGAMVRIMTTMETAWKIAFEMKCLYPKLRVATIKPDGRKKAMRSRMVQGVVRDWPDKVTEHEIDAAWAAMRKG